MTETYSYNVRKTTWQAVGRPLPASPEGVRHLLYTQEGKDAHQVGHYSLAVTACEPLLTPVTKPLFE